MRRIIAFFKWFLPVVILLAVGTRLINYATEQEARFRRGYELYGSAEEALMVGEFELAYSLFVQSSYEFQDRQPKAIALYVAATVGWTGVIADYNTLVELYKQALRYHPGFDEAAFNLEFLYWLKANDRELPPPPTGPPNKDDEVTNGDV